MKNNCIYAFVFLLFVACNSEQTTYVPKNTFAIEEPFEKIKISDQAFKFESSKSKTITLAGGSLIEVPENAFVDESGNTYQGEVELKYKEINSPSSIIASGIPMVYENEKGELEQFESAGMFDIRAFGNGKTLQVADDKKLLVQMAGTIKGDYDSYFLETKPDVSSAGVVLANQSKPGKSYYWRKLNTTTDQKNDTAFGNYENFEMKFDTARNYLLKDLSKIKWKFAGDKKSHMNPNHPINQMELERFWVNVKISKPKYYDEYEVLVREKNSDIIHGEFYDSTHYIILYSNGQIYFYDNGKILKPNLPLPVSEENLYLISLYKLNNGNYLFTSLNEDYNSEKGWIMDPDFKIIKTLKNADEYFYRKNEDYFISNNLNEINNKSQVTTFDLNGNEISTFSLIGDIEYKNSRCGFSKCFYDRQFKDYFYSKSLNQINIYGKKGLLEIISIDKDIYSNNSSFIYISKGKIVYRNLNNKKSTQLELNIDTATIRFEGSSPDFSKLILSSNNNNVYKYYNVDFISKEIKFMFQQQQNSNSNLHFLFSKIENFVQVLDYENNYYFDLKENKKYVGQLNYLSQNYYIDEHKFQICYTKTRKSVLDLKSIDTSICAIRLDTSNKNVLYVINRSGKLRVMDLNGKILDNYYTGIIGKYIYINVKEKKIHKIDGFSNVEAFDFNGVFLKKYSYYDAQIMDDISGLKQKSNYLEIEYNKLLKYNRTNTLLPNNAYLIEFEDERHRKFTTLVYLSKKEKESIENFQKKRESMYSSVSNSSSIILRRMEISKMGIYNWDIKYDNPAIVKVPLILEPADSVVLLDITPIYLITGVQQNVVVKYNLASLNEFIIDTTIKNTVVIVQPKDRIALCDQDALMEAYKKRKNGRMKIKPKLLPRLESQEKLDEILNSKGKV